MLLFFTILYIEYLTDYLTCIRLSVIVNHKSNTYPKNPDDLITEKNRPYEPPHLIVLNFTDETNGGVSRQQESDGAGGFWS